MRKQLLDSMSVNRLNALYRYIMESKKGRYLTEEYLPLFWQCADFRPLTPYLPFYLVSPHGMEAFSKALYMSKRYAKIRIDIENSSFWLSSGSKKKGINVSH